jgi:hypothetical protein
MSVNCTLKWSGCSHLPSPTQKKFSKCKIGILGEERKVIIQNAQLKPRRHKKGREK